MKLSKVHFCCHFGLLHESEMDHLEKVAQSLIKKPLVKDKFAALGQEPVISHPDTYGEPQILIGPEDEEPISISFYKQQISFCFSEDKKYEPTEKDVYSFVGKVIGSLPKELSVEGYLLKAVGIIDDLEAGYLEKVGGHLLNPSLSIQAEQFSGITLEESLEISGYDFRLKYEFRPVRLKKSKRELLEIRYDLTAARSKEGMSSRVLQDLFAEEMSKRLIFQNLIEEKLPNG